MCIALTDDTRLARPERLEEVEEICRRWTCDKSAEQLWIWWSVFAHVCKNHPAYNDHWSVRMCVS